jgi:hypothetical protein
VRSVALVAGLVALAVVPAGSARATPSGCAGRALRATFAYVPGSGAAGHVSYALRVPNASHAPCTLAAIPRMRLLDARGRALPTRVVPARRGGVARVLLEPGRSVRATARFSPDVPGPGEPTRGPCERAAATLRITLARGAPALAPIRPRTSVCERGRMVFSPLRAT